MHRRCPSMARDRTAPRAVSASLVASLLTRGVRLFSGTQIMAMAERRRMIVVLAVTRCARSRPRPSPRAQGGCHESVASRLAQQILGMLSAVLLARALRP